MKYRSVFISDTHLGSLLSDDERLLIFLSNLECEHLYLIGDIFDGWALERNFKWKESYNTIIQKILRLARKGTKVTYIYGNHDYFMHDWQDVGFGNITVLRETVHKTVSGQRILVLHGDQFDGCIANHKWVQHIGSVIYDISLQLNKISLLFRFSLSKFLKQKAKSAVNYINNYEYAVVKYCKNMQCDGIITGHIHNPKVSIIDGVMYYNTGDWVEPGHNTAIVEDNSGKLELIHV